MKRGQRASAYITGVNRNEWSQKHSHTITRTCDWPPRSCYAAEHILPPLLFRPRLLGGGNV